MGTLDALTIARAVAIEAQHPRIGSEARARLLAEVQAYATLVLAEALQALVERRALDDVAAVLDRDERDGRTS